MTDEERDLLIRDKYNGDAGADLSKDEERLKGGEPLAYVIGWIPFLGLRINLHTRPLIPRPETEWWTEQLISHLKERFGDRPFSLCDLCAGSGAIGLSVLKVFPHASVSFGEIDEAHAALIQENIEINGLDSSRAHIRSGDLFAPFKPERFDIIATNPPYIPEGRILDTSVTAFEPARALYAGTDGLDLIIRIAQEAPHHLSKDGELWVECDISNIEKAQNLLMAHGAERVDIRTDLYGRPRILVGYYA